MTINIELEAVKQNGLAIQFAGNITDEIRLAAVQQNGLALSFIPYAEQTLPIVEAAVNENCDAIHYAKEEYKTTEVLLSVVNVNGNYLSNIPAEKQTESIVMAAVRKINPPSLSVNPVLQYASVQSTAICLTAMEDTGLSLQYVMPAYLTEEVCLAAVTNNGFALQFVPENLQTEAVCLAAVRQNGKALQYVIN